MSNLFSKVGRASSSLHENVLSAISLNNSPVVQTVEHAISNTKVMSLNPISMPYESI